MDSRIVTELERLPFLCNYADFDDEDQYVLERGLGML